VNKCQKNRQKKRKMKKEVREHKDTRGVLKIQEVHGTQQLFCFESVAPIFTLAMSWVEDSTWWKFQAWCTWYDYVNRHREEFGHFRTVTVSFATCIRDDLNTQEKRGARFAAL